MSSPLLGLFVNAEFSTVALPINNNLQVPAFESELIVFHAHGLESKVKRRLVTLFPSGTTGQLKNAPLNTPLCI